MAAVDDKPVNPDLEEIYKALSVTTTWLLSAYGFGCLAIFLRCLFLGMGGAEKLKATAWLGLMSTGILWSFAWVTAGFLFGFIFGVPKVVAQTGSPQPADSSGGLKVNTNLEDISDWLTKILVGATLTQIVKIPGAIANAAKFMANGNSADLGFNAAILLFYSALGFLGGYILTRLFFARAFALADQGTKLTDSARLTLQSLPVAFGAAPPADPAVKKAAMETANIPLTGATSGSDALAIAKGAAVSGDAERAVKAASLAVQKNPEDPAAQLTYAWSLQKLGANLTSIIPIVQQAAKKATLSAGPQIMSWVYTSLSYLHLYENPPEGYEKALQVLSEYDSKNGPANADIELNRSCAFAQKFKYLSEPLASDPTSDQSSTKRGSDEEIAAARQGALDAIKKSLRLDPTEIGRFRELMWVTADPQDSDLAVFQTDAEFIALIPRH